MPRGARFIDVLEEKLRAIPLDMPTVNEAHGYATLPRHVVYTPLYRLHVLALGARVEPNNVTHPACEPVSPRISQHPPVAQNTTSRRLTLAEQRSLDAINRLGASVDVNFSASDLRSAFRLLARRYHPDRHPGATAPDRQRLSQQFTIVRSSYETLRRALEAPTR